MTRQHATPLLLQSGGAPVALRAVDLSTTTAENLLEGPIQQLIHDHPSCLPIAEIDPTFANPIPICRELHTTAGDIDNFMVTASGLPVLVECKLWRNPEGRREVIGQILDYAKELSRWSSSDLQREVSRRLKYDGNAILELVRAAGHSIDEIDFNDALTTNLRRGRFLLLIVGDGIREGVEAITEYLQVHAGLHFTLGLVELPIFALPSGDRVVVPRVLARTHLVTRTVIAVPESHQIEDASGQGDTEIDPDRLALADEQQRFWEEFLNGLRLDDPEQRKANPTRQGAIYFPLPGPKGSVWLTVYRNMKNSEVGLFLSYTRRSEGERVVLRILDDWDAVSKELGGSAELFVDSGQKSVGTPRTLILDKHHAASLNDSAERARAFDWLHRRTNEFLNVLRPRIRGATADLELEGR